jgi:hypothetical protein
LIVGTKEGSFFDGGHSNGHGSSIVLLNDFEIQGGLVHGLKIGIGPLHDLLV